MSRRFKDMQTEEQRYAAQQAQRPAPARPASPVSRSEWREMNTNQRGAHIARLMGDEDGAREFERYLRRRGQ